MTNKDASGILKTEAISHIIPEVREALWMGANALEQTTWIPCSERLPGENNYCLCCDKDGYMTIGFILKWSKEWCFDDDEIYIDVVAWMPLPKPYEPQESETWNGIHAQITAQKGTFERIFNDADDDDNDI